jgi:hypothetical protein
MIELVKVFHFSIVLTNAWKPLVAWENNMISDPVIAKQISDLVLEASSRLDESIALAQRSCTTEEFQDYRRAAGRVLGEMLLGILNPLYEKHRLLKPPGFE